MILQPLLFFFSNINGANNGAPQVRFILLESRAAALEAVRSGFWQALLDLSPEASPFLRLLSATDWSLLLAGEEHLSAAAVARALRFRGYPPGAGVPRGLPVALARLSPDNLRRVHIFVTGAPSLPPAGSAALARFELGVQYVPGAAAGQLPVAHTCFLKVDLPSYDDEGVFLAKLMQAIQECATFDRA